MSINELKVDIESEDDFKSLYICALMMMSLTEEDMLIAHSECLSMREQMEVESDAEVLPRRSLH